MVISEIALPLAYMWKGSHQSLSRSANTHRCRQLQLAQAGRTHIPWYKRTSALTMLHILAMQVQAVPGGA